MEAEVDKELLKEVGYESEYADDDELSATYKWEVLRLPILADPEPYQPTDYTTKPGQRLVDRFRESGLQIIVKMTSIELTPENPDYPGGKWQIDGQMNEHICGTAFYYLDSENVTSSSLSFRMQVDDTMIEHANWNRGQSVHDWMTMSYGTDFMCGSCLQNYGSAEMRQGRVLGFSNVL